jgi:hypothetical protein
VESWERGVYFVLGKRWKVVGPGRWPVVPFFMDVRAVPIVPGPLGTPLQNITLTDGRAVVFSAVATAVVVDPWKAFDVDDYAESTQELVAACIAERLMDVESTRMDREKRNRLIADLIRWVNGETMQFGVAVQAIRFNNLLFNVKTYRILTDTALASTSWQ